MLKQKKTVYAKCWKFRWQLVFKNQKFLNLKLTSEFQFKHNTLPGWTDVVIYATIAFQDISDHGVRIILTSWLDVDLYN